MAGSLLRSLFVELRLEAENWNKNFREAKAEAKEFEKTIKPMKEVATDLGLAMTATGGAIVAALSAAVVQAANYSDAIRDMAIRTNSTTKEMSAFKYLAEQSGTSVEALEKGLTILTRNAFAGADSFKQLGINTKDSSGHLKSSSELFAEVSDRLSNMKDGTEKTALILKLFGKSGAELTEVLNSGSGAIVAATKATERFGTAVGQEAADAADKFNDTLNDMEQAQLGLSVALSTALLPALTELAVMVTDVIVSVQQWTAAHPGLVQALGALGVALTGAGGVLLGLAGVLTILPKLQVAFAVLTGPIGLTVAAIAALVAGLVYFRNEIAGGISAAFALFLQGIGAMDSGIAKLAKMVGAQGMAHDFELAAAQVRQQAADVKDLSNVLLAGTPTIIGNTKAVDDAKAAAKAHSIALLDSAESMKKAQVEAEKYKNYIASVNEFWEKATNSATLRMIDSTEKLVKDSVEKAAMFAKSWADAYKTIDGIVTANEHRMMEYWNGIVKDSNDHIKELGKLYQEDLQNQADARKEHNDNVFKMMVEEQEAQKATAKVMEDAMATAMGNVTSGIAKGFSDAIFHSKNFAQAVTETFRQAAEGMLQAFVVGLISPLTNELTNLGRSISKVISDASGLKSGGGGLLGFLGAIPGVGALVGGVAAGYGITKALMNRGNNATATPATPDYYSYDPGYGGFATVGPARNESNLNMGGINVEINAAPGQSAQSISDAVLTDIANKLPGVIRDVTGNGGAWQPDALLR